MVHASKPSTREAGHRTVQVWICLRLHGELEGSLGYRERHVHHLHPTKGDCECEVCVFRCIFFILCVWVFCFHVHMYVCAPRVCLEPLEPRRVCQIPWIGIPGGCKLTCGFWELNVGSLQEQQVFLTHAFYFESSNGKVLKNTNWYNNIFVFEILLCSWG